VGGGGGKREVLRGEWWAWGMAVRGIWGNGGMGERCGILEFACGSVLR
jgi:hypothetical protein